MNAVAVVIRTVRTTFRLLSVLHEKARLVQTEAVVNRANCIEISFLLVHADGTA
jgi:hypothetical protein